MTIEELDKMLPLKLIIDQEIYALEAEDHEGYLCKWKHDDESGECSFFKSTCIECLNNGQWRIWYAR